MNTCVQKIKEETGYNNIVFFFVEMSHHHTKSCLTRRK
jgi:hypothetical protein